MTAKITAIILTKDEEKNIKECIKSIVSVVERIVIIDSLSEDRTAEIARNLGCDVYLHAFENHSKQYRYGIKKANIKTPWILRMDADERLSKDSARELEDICNNYEKNNSVTGIVLRFKKKFLGKYLYHGGVYPWRKMSCYKNGFGTVEDRNMDEHIILSSGKVITMKSDSEHLDFRGLDFFIGKHNWYSSKEVKDYFENKKNTTKMSKKSWFKMNIYYKLPLGMRAHLYYLYRYYFRLGFLDGKEGKIYAFLQAYWYRFLVDAKIYECEVAKRRNNDEK